MLAVACARELGAIHRGPRPRLPLARLICPRPSPSTLSRALARHSNKVMTERMGGTCWKKYAISNLKPLALSGRGPGGTLAGTEFVAPHVHGMTLPTELASSRLSVAPMMEWTDRHYRVLARMMSLHTKLYTEMVTAGDLAKKDAEGHKLLLDCSPEELEGGGVALQLGGNDPDQLREATTTALAHPHARWAEINLNCGCPSDRVAGGANGCAGGGTFGAALMHTPDEVRACVSAMSRAACGVPVTVKCRLGTDKLNGYENLKRFVGTVATGGVQHFIIHSRECVLGGLTPKQNRSVAPGRRPLRMPPAHRHSYTCLLTLATH